MQVLAASLGRVLLMAWASAPSFYQLFQPAQTSYTGQQMFFVISSESRGWFPRAQEQEVQVGSAACERDPLAHYNDNS